MTPPVDTPWPIHPTVCPSWEPSSPPLPPGTSSPASSVTPTTSPWDSRHRLSLPGLTPLGSVQSLSHAQLSDSMDLHSMPGFPAHHLLLELAQTQLCHPTTSSCHPLLFLLSIVPSIRVFSNESVLQIRWPKYWSFNFSISPSNEYLGVISFKMDWLDLLTNQGTLKRLLQHHSSKSSILQCSPFFL